MKNKIWKFGFTLTLLIAAILLLVPLGVQWFSGRMSDDGSLVTFHAGQYVSAMIFQSKERLLIGQGYSLQHWDARTGQPVKQMRTRNGVTSFLGDGRSYLSAWRNKQTKRDGYDLVETETGKLMRQWESHSYDSERTGSSTISNDGKLMVEAVEITERSQSPKKKPLNIGGLRVRNTFDGEKRWFVEKSRSEVYSRFRIYERPLAFSPDGSLLAESNVVSQSPPEAKIIIRDAQTGKQLRTLVHCKETEACGSGWGTGWNHLAFSPDGSLLIAVGGQNAYWENEHVGAIYAFDTRTGAIKWKKRKPQSTPKVLSFSPDGSLLACGSIVWQRPGGFLGGEVTLWDTKTGKLLRTFSRETQADYIAYLQDVRKQQVQLSFQRLIKKPYNRTRLASDKSAPIRKLVFSPDGKRLAAVDEDGIVKIWPVK